MHSNRLTTWCRLRISLIAFSAGLTATCAFAQGPAESLSASFKKAVDRARQSVVAVRPLDPARPMGPALIPPVGPFRPGELMPRGLPRSGDIDAEAGGSGVVIDADRGHVLTTDRVLMGSSRAVVILPDGREQIAREIRRDPASDLAVLSIDPAGLNLATVRWGDPSRLEVGDWLVSLGQPAGGPPAISAGILSARRDGALGAPAGQLLETDTAATIVHSGGPLINLNGEVVGIHTGLASRRGGSSGMSYAIPADRARRIAADLVEFGMARHTFLGVQIEPARAPKRGVVVTSVTAGTPAALAGMRPGDAIVSIGGRPVTSVPMLQAAVEAALIGEELPLVIEHDGRRIDLKIRPQVQPVRGTSGANGRPAVPARRAETGGEERVRSRLGEQPEPDARPPDRPVPPG